MRFGFRDDIVGKDDLILFRSYSFCGDPYTLILRQRNAETTMSFAHKRAAVAVFHIPGIRLKRTKLRTKHLIETWFRSPTDQAQVTYNAGSTIPQF